MVELRKTELEAMRILWEKGPLKPSEIQENFSLPIENATLRSVLRVLMEKRHVERIKKGKAYYYQANESRGNVLSKMVRGMAHVFSGGSSADLIAQLIKTEKLSKKEIEELRRIASTRAGAKDHKGKKENIS